MLIGYSRVSTTDQCLDSQIDKLKEYGCDKIFTDVVSGSKSIRKGLTEMLDYMRRDDVVIVFRLDRLGRSLKDLIDIINIFKDKGVHFKSISENIDTATSTGNLIFHITGAFAEFERNIIRERVNTGLETARARGRKGGRPTLITSEKIQMAKLLYNDKTLNIQDILKQLNVKKSLFYKMLKMQKQLIVENGKLKIDSYIEMI